MPGPVGAQEEVDIVISRAEDTRGTEGAYRPGWDTVLRKGCLSRGRETGTWGVLDFYTKCAPSQAQIPRRLISVHVSSSSGAPLPPVPRRGPHGEQYAADCQAPPHPPGEKRMGLALPGTSCIKTEAGKSGKCCRSDRPQSGQLCTGQADSGAVHGQGSCLTWL